VYFGLCVFPSLALRQLHSRLDFVHTSCRGILDTSLSLTLSLLARSSSRHLSLYLSLSLLSLSLRDFLFFSLSHNLRRWASLVSVRATRTCQVGILCESEIDHTTYLHVLSCHACCARASSGPRKPRVTGAVRQVCAPCRRGGVSWAVRAITFVCCRFVLACRARCSLFAQIKVSDSDSHKHTHTQMRMYCLHAFIHQHSLTYAL